VGKGKDVGREERGGGNKRGSSRGVMNMCLQLCVFVLIKAMFRLEINHMCKKQDTCV
jgi:hypothetical protein